MPAELGQDFQPGSRWKRDPGIAELIKYFDQPKFLTRIDKGTFANPQALSTDDWKLIRTEGLNCQKDFVYAAKNYFWITNKETGDQLFALWESQEMIFERIMKLRESGQAQKLIVLKARQLGISTLVEGLIAWATMFNPNINSMVVGPDKNRSEYLFSIMLHIYDHMPWWLKPMCANREYDGGLLFENPDPNQRRTNQGLNSRIEIQTASQYSGIGQGIRLTCAHISEIADWPQRVARQAIEADLGPALSEQSPMTFAIIESTAEGAGTYYHDLWKTNKESGDDADWSTIFFPFFFEKSYVLAPPQGWRPGKQDITLREKIKADWVRCDNAECGRWFESYEEGVYRGDTNCDHCEKGTLKPYVLEDNQLRFIQRKRDNAAKKGADSLRKLRQELCSTATEAFQISGDPVFPEDCLEFADKCVRPPLIEGFLDKNGHIHGIVAVQRNEAGRIVSSKCHQDWCVEDHRFDDRPLKIWELPMEGHEYTMGVDVSEGLGGKHDSSVIVITRVGKMLNPDAHVVTWRSNEINHYDLAVPVVQLGKIYNYALACIEYNTYQTCADEARIHFNYPNLYRWKHLDSNNIMSSKWHWITQANSKPRLWGSAVRRLRQELWFTRSENLVTEMKTFQKDEDSEKRAGAEQGFHDDELMAAMISVYCSHETDVVSNESQISNSSGEAKNELEFKLTCLRCKHQYESDNRNLPCVKCGYMIIKATRRGASDKVVMRISMDEYGKGVKEPAGDPSYDSL